MSYTATKNYKFKDRLSTYVFVDSLYAVLYNQSKCLTFDPIRLRDPENRMKSTASILESYFQQHDLNLSALRQVDICFVDENFMLGRKNKVEVNYPSLAGVLYYFQEFFNGPIHHHHVTEDIKHYINSEYFHFQSQHLIWFHLRKNRLYVASSNGRTLITLNSFEVFKSMDVMYYILYNAKFLNFNRSNIQTLLISGDLLQMEALPTFLKSNFQKEEILTPQDIDFGGLPFHHSLYHQFPELRLEQL